MSDLIDRQAAIRWVKTECNPYGKPTLDFESGEKVIEHLKKMRSAQPDSKETSYTHKALDTISRQAAIDAAEESRRLNHHQDGKAACAHEYEHRHFLKLLRDLPSAQPDWTEIMIQCDNCGHMIHAKREDCKVSAQPEMSFDEWCTDCKEYDKDKHCCPRWNRVIRQTLKDMKEEQPEPSMEQCACCVLSKPEQMWIPCSERLPEEEQTVLVTCSDGGVYIYDRLKACDYEYDDMRFWEDNMGCYQPMEDVIAWMPLPEPYAERRTDDLGGISK